jgi:O-antigen/teichoic acid export membrane protein
MKNIAKAVFTISFFSFIERAIGFFFKIYLTKELGVVGIGIYQVAFSFFMVLITVTTSGVPLIVSKLTAQCRTEKDLCKEGEISTAALIINLTLSGIICIGMLVFNKFIGKLFADDQSRTLLLMMLPALIFSGIYSSLRGNLWGRQKYMTVSLLELAEQVARIASCILLFSFGVGKLSATGISMSIGCLVAAIVCAIVYFATGARLNNPKNRIIPLIKSSMPITAARGSTAIMNSLIAIVVPFLLIKVIGMNNTDAMYQYGYSIGMGMPLLYIPITITGSLAFVMIPTLSQTVAEGNKAALRSQIEGAIKVSIALGAIFVPMFMVLGEPISMRVYSGNVDAGRFMSFAAWLLVIISMENITSSMLNSLELEVKGLLNYLIGTIVAFSIFFISGKSFSMNLMSIGLGVGWGVSTLLNIFAMKKKTGISFSFVFTLLICGLLCVPTIFLTKWLFALFAGLPLLIRIMLAGGIGIVFITVLCFLFGILKMDLFFSSKNKSKKKDGATKITTNKNSSVVFEKRKTEKLSKKAL